MDLDLVVARHAVDDGRDYPSDGEDGDGQIADDADVATPLLPASCTQVRFPVQL